MASQSAEAGEEMNDTYYPNLDFALTHAEWDKERERRRFGEQSPSETDLEIAALVDQRNDAWAEITRLQLENERLVENEKRITGILARSYADKEIERERCASIINAWAKESPDSHERQLLQRVAVAIRARK